MVFRFSVAVAYFFYVANLGEALQIGSINALEKGFFLACAILYIRTAKIDWTVLKLGGLIVLYLIMIAFLVNYTNFSWLILIGALNQIMILFLFVGGTPSQRDRQFMLMIAALAPSGSALFGLMYHVTGIHPMFGQEFGSGTWRFQGSLGPAFLSGLAMCGTFASMLLLMENRGRFVWFLFINFVILLLAGGRMPALVTIWTCAGVYLTSPNIAYSKKILGISAGLLGGVMLTAFIVTLSDTLLTRLGSSGLNGRDIMWPYLVALGNQNFWTGIGFGHQFFATPREISILAGSTAAHNDYLKLFVEIGLPGVVFFLSVLTYTIFYIWSNRFKCRQHNILICYVGILFLMLVDNTLASVSHFPLLIFGSQPMSGLKRLHVVPSRYGSVRA